MMPEAMSRRGRQLAEQGESFVTATVVRAQRPTSVQAGDVALVLGDGTVTASGPMAEMLSPKLRIT